MFGPGRFRTEIIWKRSFAHSDTKQGRLQHGHIHDVLLFYTKSDKWTWNPIFTAYTPDYLATEYRHATSDGRRYKETDLTAAKPGGDTEYEWRVKRSGKGERWEADLDGEYLSPNAAMVYAGVRPYRGRFWAYSKQNLIDFARAGKLIHRETGMPRLMQFSDEMPGVSLQDVWDDIPPALGNEDLGYPTQKPIALLGADNRELIESFRHSARPLLRLRHDDRCRAEASRPWIGIDVTHLAVNLIRFRLQETYGETINATYKVVGEPTSVDDAAQLAQEAPFQFQAWALGLVGARLADSGKEGGDKGIDGRLIFAEDDKGGLLAP